MKFESCTFGDLAQAAGVDTRTFMDWLTEADQIQIIQLGHRLGDRKLKPRVVEFIVNKFVPELASKAA